MDYAEKIKEILRVASTEETYMILKLAQNIVQHEKKTESAEQEALGRQG